MSIMYGVEVLVNAPHNEKTILHIFQCGLSMGFIIYSKDRDWEKKSLDSLQATSLLLELLKKDEDDLYDAYFTVKFQDTDFSFRIDPLDNHTRISMFSFGSPWQRPIDYDNQTVDFARYIRLILELSKNFSVLALETSAD